jgi:hypothetical protein
MKFLRNHPLSHGQTTIETRGSLTGNSPDDGLISPQKLDDSDVISKLTFTACYLPGYDGPVPIIYNISIDFDWNNHGGAGKDGVLITSPSEFYRRSRPSASGSRPYAHFHFHPGKAIFNTLGDK